MPEPTYFYGKQQAPISIDDEIAFIPVRYVPQIIEAIESRKSIAIYDSVEEQAIAVNALNIAQWELLMGSTDRIVSEIRALRDGTDTALQAQDMSINPFTLNLFSLRSIAGRLYTDGESAAFILGQIRDRVGAVETPNTLLWAIVRIAAVIAGA